MRSCPTMTAHKKAIIVSKWRHTIIDKRANALQLYDQWTQQNNINEYNKNYNEKGNNNNEYNNK